MMTPELKSRIEKETGFAFYENSFMTGSQYIFYGTSDKLNDFKELVDGKIPSGTVCYCMDTREMYIYSLYKEEWYNF